MAIVGPQSFFGPCISVVCCIHGTHPNFYLVEGDDDDDDDDDDYPIAEKLPIEEAWNAGLEFWSRCNMVRRRMSSGYLIFASSS
jgi:hypothetical protein